MFGSNSQELQRDISDIKNALNKFEQILTNHKQAIDAQNFHIQDLEGRIQALETKLAQLTKPKWDD